MNFGNNRVTAQVEREMEQWRIKHPNASTQAHNAEYENLYNFYRRNGGPEFTSAQQVIIDNIVQENMKEEA